MKNEIRHRDESYFSRLRWRAAFALVATYLIPFVLFYAVVDYVSVRHVRDQVYAHLELGVTTNGDLLDDVLQVRVTEINSLAQAFSRAGFPPAQAPAVLRAYVDGNPWYWLLLVADASGQVLSASEEIHGNIRDREYFGQALVGKTVISDVFISPLTQKPEMVVAAPLRGKDAQAVGVLVAALRLDKLKSRLLDPGIGRTGESFLADASGRFASPSRLGGQLLTQSYEPHGLNPYQGEAGLSEHRNYRGHAVLCAYRKLRSKNYYVVAHVAQEEAFAPVRELRGAILLYVVPFLFLGVALAFAAGHYSVRYVQKLTVSLRRALDVAREREHERDLAHQELAHRFEEERELARQKAQFQAQLAEYERNTALAQLAMGAAHEINNPLAGILSYLELELEGAESKDDRAEIEQCIEAAHRISATLRSLLNYARPGPLQLCGINLDQLVSDTFGFLRQHPLFRGKALEKDIHPDLPAISGDANQLSQVLMNLLLNAADATPPGGKITVFAERAGPADKIEIRVSDTGSGIPADVLPRVFDPFFTTKRGKGTGLGLSITQTYVRGHGGDIQIETAPQKGTTVRITLPIEQETPPVARNREVVT